MAVETTRAIGQYCSRYGDKFVELMERCGSYCLPDVPEEEAIQYLKELEDSKCKDGMLSHADIIRVTKG